jgi:hypothetical protein
MLNGIPRKAVACAEFPSALWGLFCRTPFTRWRLRFKRGAGVEKYYRRPPLRSWENSFNRRSLHRWSAPSRLGLDGFRPDHIVLLQMRGSPETGNSAASVRALRRGELAFRRSGPPAQPAAGTVREVVCPALTERNCPWGVNPLVWGRLFAAAVGAVGNAQLPV